MPYKIQNIASIINADAKIIADAEIEYLLIDSRKIIFPTVSLFFALHGPRRDGHQFIVEVYERGVRNFVVKKGFDASSFNKANFLFVNDVLQTLQALAAFHRKQFSIPVIGITGSNGKTIVKEWLYQLLQEDENIVRSPRSYNSQVGVPLSVWQINKQNTLGIFEAGISTKNEMPQLEQIIQPTIGVLTNIGEAHSEGFTNDAEKINEKLKLFSHCTQLIFQKEILPDDFHLPQTKLFSWSKKNVGATVFIKEEIKTSANTLLTIVYQNQSQKIVAPFTDAASIDNAVTCYCTLLSLNYSNEIIAKRLLQLTPVEMRLQLKKGINNCSVLNDSYSNDISSLSIALDYLKQQSGNKTTTVIFSDILQSGLSDDELYRQVAVQLQERKIHKLIGIGENISKHHSLFNQIQQTTFFSSTEQFLEQTTLHQFKDEFILLKGARIFAFERISKWLEQKVHQTVLEINLSAIAHNLKEYQKHLLPSTKVMAMVKAYSYGSGSAEVARVLQFCKIDYLAVAYADEGVELRKAGISLPIMVMNADEESFDALIEYSLEPEIYSFHIFNLFHQYLQQQAVAKFPIHIKLNTGMNRLGFETDEIN
ncbi:MAG: alanine racemase, partial [Bacteroidota bacterium]|nr:alanine racemase [Bacteroidota bacterium]